MPRWVGYEPQRLAALRSRAVEAADDLRAIVSADPAAIGALQTVRLAREHVETRLLPLVGRILGSESLVAWHSTGPAVAFGRRSPVLGAARLRATGPLAGLDDDQLLDEYDDALNVLWAALTYSGSPDVDTAWARMVAVLDELTTRAAADPHFLERLAADEDSAHTLARLAYTLDWSVREPISPRPTDDALNAAAELFAVTAANDEIATRLGELGFETPALGHLLSRASLPRSVMVNIAQQVLVRAGSYDALDTPLTRAAAITAGNEALQGLLSDQDAALDLLLDRDAVTQLLTLRLDQAHVEHVVALGLGTAAHDDPSRLGDGLDALANVVAVADAERIEHGGARGVAIALGVYVPHLVNVQPGRDVMVSLGTDDPDTATTTLLGSYDQVKELLQEIVSDEQAQLTLGVIAREHTTNLVRAAAAELPANVERPEANDHIAGSLAPHGEFLRMVVSAVATENSDRVAAQAALVSSATSPVRTIGTIAGFLPSPVARGVSAAASPAADVFGWLMNRGEPDEVPDTGFMELTMMDFTFDVVELVVGDASLRRAYGIDLEARAVLTRYAASYRETDDLREKAALETAMRTYLTNRSGETLGSSLEVISSDSRFANVPRE